RSCGRRHGKAETGAAGARFAAVDPRARSGSASLMGDTGAGDRQRCRASPADPGAEAVHPGRCGLVVPAEDITSAKSADDALPALSLPVHEPDETMVIV